MSTAIDTTTTALAPFKEMRDLVANYPSDRYHVLLPTTYLGSSSLFIPTPVVMTVDPNDERDVYKTPGSRDDSLCFHAIALERIASGSGIDFDPSLTRHRHDRSKEPLVCEQIAAGWYIDSLGQRRLITSPWVTQDLRDKSPRANLLTRNGGTVAIEVARQFICEQCGARARSSAIRKALNLKGSYKRAELLVNVQRDGKTVQEPKPFVAFRFRLDESDPDVKRALIARHHGAIAEVFGIADKEALEPPSRANPDAMEDIQGEVIDAEPAIPDEPKPVPAAKKADVGAVIDGLRSAAKARPDAKEAASDEMLTNLAYALREVWALTDKDAIGVARRTVSRAVFGAAKLRDMTTAQVMVVVDASKELAGQAALAEVRDFLAQVDTDFGKAVGPTK